MKNIKSLTRRSIKGLLLILISSLFLVWSCQNDADQDPAPSMIQDMQKADDLTANVKSLKAAKNFVAPMEGAQEVPPADTKARGNAIFHLRDDGLHYRIIVANLENLSMAHIHLAPAGSNGGVVVWLHPSGPPPQLIPGRTSGILATGIITEANLVGSLAEGTLEDLLEHMRMGNAYVNVHTTQYPGGEIRGQIKPAGPK
ncbi:hypothetical protein BH23BAC1_BH23BAC1_27780 [soil metagenome]